MLTTQILENMKRPIGEAAQMPGFAYHDPAVMQQEFRRIFGCNWISIGFAQQVKAPGDILPVRIADQLLLIVRGLDGKVRVFHNVCRHRGLQLVADTGVVCSKTISCPYHGWTYGLDGQCISAPYWYREELQALRPKLEQGFGLIEVRSRTWLDFVFVDLSGNARSFDEAIAPIEALWGVSAIAPLSLATIWEREMPANWKLVIENFMDPYHIAFVHPESGSVKTHSMHQVVRPSRDIVSQRTPGGAVDKPRSGSIPTIPQLEKVLGADYQTFWLFPNTTLLAQPSFVSLRTMLPTGADTTYQFNAIYVANEATADRFEGERRRLIDASNLVNDQDVSILARLQATRTSLAVGSCKFAPQWDSRSQMFQVRVAESLLD